MLLPSGRSNSDVYSLQNAQKPPFLTRTSSPQLSAKQPAFVTGAPAATASNTTAPPTTAGKAGNGFSSSKPTTRKVDTKTSTSTTPAASPSESGTDRVSKYPQFLENNNVATVAQSSATPTTATKTQTASAPTTTATTVPVLAGGGTWQEIDCDLESVQLRLKQGWTVHIGKEGRLYYCNHLTQTSSWLPSCEDWSCSEQLPYGWERAVDSKGRSYYINHINKTSTYEAPECVRWDESPPQPRVAVLQRSATLGFGFVAGSERPVIVRFVTDGGPSMHKLQPGDHILAVNGEDVREAARDHVIQLVRACDSHVTLLVSQPARTFAPGRKSTLLSAGKRAKLRTRPSRVRFAESVCVNGAPLFPPSAFSLGDICVPPMANVLKVFLENGQTKSFKYDTTTTVQDVVTSLLDKLCLSTGEICSLVLEHVKSLRRNKLTLLDPNESLARIAARPGAHKLRCLFRVTFVPIAAAELAQKDLNALDYLYMQCCNDVTQERFAPELQPEVALRLAALHMHQHALANNVSPAKLTVKIVEREFGLERFVPSSLFEGMKRKELRRLISHFLKLNAEMTGSSAKVLTQLQAKLHYLDIIASLPSYGAKCFSTNQREGVERVLLVSPRFGLSQISSARNSIPQLISTVEDFSHVLVRREDDVTCSVAIFMRGERVIKFSMEDRDACEFSLVLAGYYRLKTGKELPVDREREPHDEDNAPSYLAQHTVLPENWSYLSSFHNRAHSINFLTSPPYHAVQLNEDPKPDSEPEPIATTNVAGHEQCDRNMNSANVANSNHKPTKMAFLSSETMDLDMHSVMATEILEEAKDSGLSDSSGGGSNANYYSGERAASTSALTEANNEEVLRRVHEMQKMVENSEQYLTEQGEHFNELNAVQRRTSGSGNFCGPNSWLNDSVLSTGSAAPQEGLTEFDSDCDSLNSSKFSSAEDAPQPGALKHSDSLVLLAEAINQDLSGITKGLNSIGSGQQNVEPGDVSETSSPRDERKFNGFGQLLSNLQALGTDYSQSESDSESVQSPTNSPTTRRPTFLLPGDRSANRKQTNAYRCSFGLHSPDGTNFGAETKDYNLKEYLKQLKEISKVDDVSHDTDVAAKKLSEIYGFEIHEDTFIETDSDLIDLRTLPPPQTPDQFDGLSLLSAPAPHGFADGSGKHSFAPDTEADLDRFLAKVVVAPPTHKTTPAKELTPEEIMSFIIPPPPNLDVIERVNEDQQQQQKAENAPNKSYPKDESLYSNSMPAHPRNRSSSPRYQKKHKDDEGAKQTKVGHVIEYATVERKSKFSCCPKSTKEETPSAAYVDASQSSHWQLPPRRRTQTNEASPPVRPPKSAELISRYSPKKQPLSAPPQPLQRTRLYSDSTRSDGCPPTIPPRISPTQRSSDERCVLSAVSLAPKIPPLPPIIIRLPNQLRGPNAPPAPFANGSPPPTQPRSTPRPMGNNHSTFHPQIAPHSNEQYQSKPDCQPLCPKTPPPANKRPPLSLLCSPQMARKTQNQNPAQRGCSCTPSFGDKMIMKNGHVIDGEALLAKTDVAMAGLLVKLDQVAAQCSAAQAAGGGSNIDEEKFQRSRNELTEQTLVLVTASKFLVVAMSDMKFATLPEHLTSCLTAIRRITELTQDMTRHTSSPLQTRNIVLKVHDVASSFRELVAVQIGPLGAGQLALQAECLANVLATLLRSLRVFSP